MNTPIGGDVDAISRNLANMSRIWRKFTPNAGHIYFNERQSAPSRAPCCRLRPFRPQTYARKRRIYATRGVGRAAGRVSTRRLFLSAPIQGHRRHDITMGHANTHLRRSRRHGIRKHHNGQVCPAHPADGRVFLWRDLGQRWPGPAPSLRGNHRRRDIPRRCPRRRAHAWVQPPVHRA